MYQSVFNQCLAAMQQAPKIITHLENGIYTGKIAEFKGVSETGGVRLCIRMDGMDNTVFSCYVSEKFIMKSPVCKVLELYRDGGYTIDNDNFVVFDQKIVEGKPVKFAIKNNQVDPEHIYSNIMELDFLATLPDEPMEEY